MKKKEIEVLKLEQDFRDTLENELIQNKLDNKKVVVKDVKFLGKANWKDKLNGKNVYENVFIVEKEVKEIDEKGNERITNTINYYLGDRCVAGEIGNGELIYSENFKNSEFHKMQAINELCLKVSIKDIENMSLNRLEEKEMEEILLSYSEENIKKNKDKNELDKRQVEKVKVNGIQKVDLNKLVDGKETLGKRLDLQKYDSLYVVYSDKINEVTSGVKRNNTTYSLVGMTKDGEAKVLNDEFQMDESVGNNGERNQTKIRANSVATRDNKDVSVYTRKSNGMSIGCENNQGDVDMFLYQKTLGENENVGIQIETSKTPIIPIETKEIMNRSKGIYQKDKVQDEVEEHIQKGYKTDNVKDFDGDKETLSYNYSTENILNDFVMEIFNYENENGEEIIKEVFTIKEIKDKLIRVLKENSNKIPIEQVVENVKEEMNQDAEIFVREHKI